MYIFASEPKPLLKIGTANAICRNYLGLGLDTTAQIIFFKNKTFLGFTKFFFKHMLKVSAFYLEKQKSFIPKENMI